MFCRTDTLKTFVKLQVLVHREGPRFAWKGPVKSWKSPWFSHPVNSYIPECSSVPTVLLKKTFCFVYKKCQLSCTFLAISAVSLTETENWFFINLRKFLTSIFDYVWIRGYIAPTLPMAMILKLFNPWFVFNPRASFPRWHTKYV